MPLVEVGHQNDLLRFGHFQLEFDPSALAHIFFMVPAMIPPLASSPLFSPFLGLLLAFFPAIKLGQSLLRLAEVAQAGVRIDRLKAERVL